MMEMFQVMIDEWLEEAREFYLKNRKKIDMVRKGYKLSAETREKMRQAHLGKHHSEDTLRKISKTWFKKGHKLPEEIEQKRRERQKAAMRKFNKGHMHIIPEARLKKLYLVQRLSTLQIAKVFNVSYSTINLRLREYGIKLRRKGREKGCVSEASKEQCSIGFFMKRVFEVSVV